MVLLRVGAAPGGATAIISIDDDASLRSAMHEAPLPTPAPETAHRIRSSAILTALPQSHMPRTAPCHPGHYPPLTPLSSLGRQFLSKAAALDGALQELQEEEVALWLPGGPAEEGRARLDVARTPRELALAQFGTIHVTAAPVAALASPIGRRPRPPPIPPHHCTLPGVRAGSPSPIPLPLSAASPLRLPVAASTAMAEVTGPLTQRRRPH